ncbi:hypothetical protein [Nocardioides alcanivorans]|uniref:hypothetical protein n=1 Tax=Nocardioides alcanivorans TaxID=2897352 RepID=UPI001F2A7EC1|nr:hypothetical protein [Nocardioides alcanivorans]
MLALAWRTPRYAKESGRPANSTLTRIVDSPRFTAATRTLGFAFFLFVASAAIFGGDSLLNPVFGVFFSWLWVGIVPLSLLFGSFYKAISPARTLSWLLARATGSDPDRGLREYPARLGLWPAALGLFAFVWFELVYPFSNEIGPVRLWFALYLGVMIVGGAVYGSSFMAKADPFEALSTLVGRLSPWQRDDRGNLVVRSPLANLSHTPRDPGLVAVTSVLLGSTAFDSFKGSPTWTRFVLSNDVSVNLLNLLGLIGLIGLVAGLFVTASVLTGVNHPDDRWRLPSAYAHSLVPIIVGYFVAHYLSFLVEYGQTTMLHLNDPYVNGSNLLGLAGRTEWMVLSSHPTALSVIKVLGVVVGHIFGVIAAHDRALELLPKRHQLTGQLSMLVVMVCFTVGGLVLLFSA